jgi:hypothetical protein
MSKPLHKDLSFWIVAITLVTAANVAQLYFAVPWLQGRVAASRSAPRMKNLMPFSVPPVRTANEGNP